MARIGPRLQQAAFGCDRDDAGRDTEHERCDHCRHERRHQGSDNDCSSGGGDGEQPEGPGTSTNLAKTRTRRDDPREVEISIGACFEFTRAEQQVTSLSEGFEVIAIATDVRVRESGPQSPGPAHLSGIGIDIDSEQEGRLLTRHAPLSGGVKVSVLLIPAARPLPAITSAIFREASSIISSPSIAAPRAPPAAEVYHSYASKISSAWS